MVFYHYIISPLQSSFRNAFLHYCDYFWLTMIVHSFRFKPYYLFTGESIFFTIERRSTIYPKVQFFHMATEGKNERTKKLRRLALYFRKVGTTAKLWKAPILYWTKWKERKPSKAAKDRESGLFGGLHSRILHIVQNLWPARKHTQHFFLLYFWTTNWYLVS